ncbi:MAG TPA: DUF4142 domain-containing protein, partial [Nannocystis sp.]
LPATQSPPDDPAAVAVAARPQEAEVKAPPEHLTNDDEIYGVLEEINDQAIEQAEYAAKWAKSQRVRELASTIMADHAAFRERADATRERLGLRKTGSRLADEVEKNSKQSIEIMKKVEKGDPLDKSYVDIQVDAHRLWIEYIDTKLMPQAQMPDLRVELNNFRAVLERHYDLAREIQATYTPKT